MPVTMEQINSKVCELESILYSEEYPAFLKATNSYQAKQLLKNIKSAVSSFKGNYYPENFQEEEDFFAKAVAVVEKIPFNLRKTPHIKTGYELTFANTKDSHTRYEVVEYFEGLGFTKVDNSDGAFSPNYYDYYILDNMLFSVYNQNNNLPISFNISFKKGNRNNG